MLVLRIVLACGLFVESTESVASAEFVAVWLFCGVLIATGFLTPFAPAAVMIVELEQFAVSHGIAGSSLLLATTDRSMLEAAIAMSLVLIGPGAYSVDARIFGLREIIVPTKGHR